jgi:2-deoxy-D-gluconate 3-dehydrogenase
VTAEQGPAHPEHVLDQFSLADKRAFVTGAGRGIGKAIAVALAQAGASIALSARSVDELIVTQTTIARNGGTSGIVPSDLTSNEAIASIVDTAEDELGGQMDIVVHAAGITRRGPASTFAFDDWSAVLQVDLVAPFLLSQEIGRRQLTQENAGSHIFIASLASVLGLENTIAYNAAKAGLLGVVRGLSKEWSRHGIRVNAIAPGYVETAMTEDLLADPERRQKLLGRIPMDRFGTPADFAAPALFLASDAAAYMTGQLLVVDGGYAAA